MTDDTAEREALVKLEQDLLYKLLIAGTATAEDQAYAAGWIRRLTLQAATALESLAPPQTVTEEMVTRAIDALVYTGYNDETQKRIIRQQATCREYVRAALQSAFAAAPPPTSTNEHQITTELLDKVIGYFDGMLDERVDHKFDARQRDLLTECLNDLRCARNSPLCAPPTEQDKP